MIPSACLHPIRVYNESRGKYYSVPCGHCSACLNIKSSSRTFNLEQKFYKYPYRYFATLTYSDEFLPLARLTDEGLCYSNDVNRFGKPHTVLYGDFNYINSSLFIDKSLKNYGGVPVLSHSDVINFKKRLNYYLYKNGFKEKYFIHVCGEYGPTGYRPHYHMLLSSPRPVECLEVCIRSAWSVDNKNSSGSVRKEFGYVDFQVVCTKGATDYVAKYLNCNSHLPFILSRSVFRPFSTTSKPFRITYDEGSEQELREFYDRLPVKTSVRGLKTGEVRDTYATRFNNSRFFPFISRYGSLTHEARCVLYSVASRFSGFTSVEFSEMIYDVLKPSDYNSRNKINDLFVSCFVKQERFQHDEVLDALYDYSFVPHLTAQSVKDSLSKLYNASRIVLKNSSTLGVSLSDYLKRMDLFLSKVELFNLKRFYEYQITLLNDPLKPCSLKSIFPLYLHTDIREMSVSQLYRYMSQFGVDDIINIEDLPEQKAFRCISDKIMLDTSKTKKRNDFLSSKGIKPNTYIPHINFKFNIFLNK